MEASLTPLATKTDLENASTADKGIVQRNDKDRVQVASKTAISGESAKGVFRDKTEKDEKSLMATSQLPPATDQKIAITTSSASVIGAGSSSTVPPHIGAISGVPREGSTEGLPALLPGKVSLPCLTLSLPESRSNLDSIMWLYLLSLWMKP